MERSNKVDHNMIEDMMNNGHGHREQASISHRRAQKAAIHSGRHSDRPFIQYKTYCSLDDCLALEKQKETGCGETDVSPVPEPLFLFWNAVLMPEHADLRNVNWSVCLCTQSIINCVFTLCMQADLSADYSNQSGCIDWGQWVQFCLLFCMWNEKVWDKSRKNQASRTCSPVCYSSTNLTEPFLASVAVIIKKSRASVSILISILVVLTLSCRKVPQEYWLCCSHWQPAIAQRLHPKKLS